MNKPSEINMQNCVSNQKEMNQLLAHKLGCDELTAFKTAMNVYQCLTVPVTDSMFTALAPLCFKLGIYKFNESMALEMVNNNAKKPLIDRCIKTMLSLN
jgi:GH24 family phage-related lysozyme (muramidase)